MQPSGPDRRAGSISAALDAAAPGSTLRVAPGLYQERLVVSKPSIQLVSEQNGGAELEWVTQSPYEAALVVESTGVSVVGFKISHSSPSVASNYGVLVTSGAAARLFRCEVTSKRRGGF